MKVSEVLKTKNLSKVNEYTEKFPGREKIERNDYLEAILPAFSVL